MSAATDLETTSATASSTTEPLIRLLDDLRQVTNRAGRTDLTARLIMARAKVGDPRVRIVVVGEPRKGMSTLVNGLVGTEVSATNSDASVPVIVEYGEKLTTAIVRADGQGQTERTMIDPRNSAALLAAPAAGVVRAEFTVPNPLLAEGIVVMDAPGANSDDPARSATTWSIVSAAEAVLFVSDGSREYSAKEIAYLQQLRQICPTVICVLNKIDVFPHWQEVQQANRELLDNAGLEFAIFPVSAGMRDYANRSGDTQLDVESGVPQLVDYLRQHVITRADAIARDAVLNDIRVISDHVAMAFKTESDALRDPRRAAEITERLRAARQNADDLRQRSANWQLTLADGCTELMNDVEHDLRHRLRSLVRAAEAEIMKTDPARRWKDFQNGLDVKIADAVGENFVIAHTSSVELADQVAAKFPAEGRIVTLPELHVDNAETVLDPVQPLEPLESAKSSVTSQLLTSLRGSYGGVLMVGLVTSLLGQALVNVYSIGAGVLLGANAYWDDRKMRKSRRQAEAKVAVSRLMDDVIFQVSKESRFRLRAVQRTLRDHFTEIANETLRSVDDSLQAAQDASNVHQSHRTERIAEIEDQVQRLSQLRQRAASIASTSKAT